MNKKNTIILSEALNTLKGNWSVSIIAFLVIYTFWLAVSFIPKLGTLVSLLISGPVILGMSIFSLELLRKKTVSFNTIFKDFNHYFIALKAYCIMCLYVFLWFLLLIIPGIIRAIAYSMTFYIIADNPDIGAREALKKSKTMMYGYKWKYFLLNLRFLGWALLCLLTLGIGFLWLTPYVQITLANFYENIKEGSVGSSDSKTDLVTTL